MCLVSIHLRICAMTKHYLQLNTSLAGADSVSSRLASDTIERLVAADRAAGPAVVSSNWPPDHGGTRT